MGIVERRRIPGLDRRRFSRGGQRATDVPGRHPRVIVADSYEGARRPCIRYLDHFNFDVAAATDGQALVNEIGAQSPAVILMDSQWENPQTRERLDEASRLQEIPVIVLVGAMGEAGELGLEAFHAAAILAKPFALAVMLETVRRVLRARTHVHGH